MTAERPEHLTVMACCATCTHYRGFCDSAWCARWSIRVLPQTKCDSYERTPHIPLWIVAEPVGKEP